MRLPQVEGDDVGREKVGEWLEGVCGGGEAFWKTKWERGREKGLTQREKIRGGKEG